jgi:anti-anti-sigma factor
LKIFLCERIDSTNAADVEKEIMGIYENNPAEIMILDADKLEYISSAGLRIIMKLIKMRKKVSIINTTDAVYDILETTGFTKIIPVEKKA